MLTIIDKQIDVEVAEYGELLAILKKRFGALELCIALLAAVLYFF